MTTSDPTAAADTARTAAITGAGRGIGRAIGTTLRAAGHRVAHLDIRAPDDRSDLTEPDEVMFVECDVADEVAVDSAFSRIEASFGPVEILVNNAGIFTIEPLGDTSREAWDRMFAVNVTGAFLCTKRAVPGMKANGWGRVISIGSSAGKTGGSKHMAAYGASKAALMAFAKAVASEYACHGITSNALAPALIDTAMVDGIADFADRIPVGRLGQPHDVAAAVAFLASEEASFITAEVMDVNGGFLID